MRGRPTASVQYELDVRLLVPGTGSVALPVTLSYDSADPYAVHALFRTGHRDGVAWVFARDTLAAGVVEAAGEGDVRVWPASASSREGSGGAPSEVAGTKGTGEDRAQDVVYIALSSPDGQALLEAPAGALTAFLLRTYSLVPRGSESEHLDLDSTLAALLAD